MSAHDALRMHRPRGRSGGGQESDGYGDLTAGGADTIQRRRAQIGRELAIADLRAQLAANRHRETCPSCDKPLAVCDCPRGVNPDHTIPTQEAAA